MIAAVFFLPKKTTARAVQPNPLEMFGTNEEILMLKNEPAIAPSAEAMHQAYKRSFVTFVPLACNTFSSLPEILM